jgi:hypothetical protein
LKEAAMNQHNPEAAALAAYFETAKRYRKEAAKVPVPALAGSTISRGIPHSQPMRRSAIARALKASRHPAFAADAEIGDRACLEGLAASSRKR